MQGTLSQRTNQRQWTSINKDWIILPNISDHYKPFHAQWTVLCAGSRTYGCLTGHKTDAFKCCDLEECLIIVLFYRKLPEILNDAIK